MHPTPAQALNDSTLHLPRILCLHGGGTNARIFRAQCRGLVNQLKTEFRFVFAQAPFSSHAGPDVLSVYGQWGPFKRWLRWRPEHPKVRPEDIIEQLDQSMEDVMNQDNAYGATGEWIALLGFSQGAKLSASLLYRQQCHEEMGNFTGNHFRFGILLAGRGPLFSLDPDSMSDLPDASHITDVEAVHRQVIDHEVHILHVPTIHVHGMLDMGLDLHRQLYEEYCDPRCRQLVEWDGDHRMPLKRNDTLLVAEQIRRFAKETKGSQRLIC